MIIMRVIPHHGPPFGDHNDLYRQPAGRTRPAGRLQRRAGASYLAGLSRHQRSGHHERPQHDSERAWILRQAVVSWERAHMPRFVSREVGLYLAGAGYGAGGCPAS